MSGWDDAGRGPMPDPSDAIAESLRLAWNGATAVAAVDAMKVTLAELSRDSSPEEVREFAELLPAYPGTMATGVLLAWAYASGQLGLGPRLRVPSDGR